MDNYSNDILPIGKKLRGGTITIIGHLSSGGFGNTYIVQNNFDEVLAMKEFFMKDINQRERDIVTVSVTANRKTYDSQREKFTKEAKRLRKLNNEHVVHVHDLFDENNTSYYVMDYIEGESLASRLRRTNKPLPQNDVIGILQQLLEALSYIHSQGIWHLDIKPANIMVDKSGNVVLIDFGASKQMDSKGSYTATSTMLCYSPHFAPLEQIEQNLAKIGPWTDFYSLGATLYNLLTNTMPPSSSDISAEGKDAFAFNNDVTTDVQQFIILLMRPSWKERPQDIDGVHYLLGLIAERNKKGNIIEIPKTTNSSQLHNESAEKSMEGGLHSSAVNSNVNDVKTSYEEDEKRNNIRMNTRFYDQEQTSFESIHTPQSLLDPLIERAIETSVSDPNRCEVIKRLIRNMVYVEGGKYKYAPDNLSLFIKRNGWIKENENFEHPVDIQSFYINRYVLTNEDVWALTSGKYGGGDSFIISHKKFGFKQRHYPFVRGGLLIWEAIEKLNSITHLNFCLPTVHQWEYAARGGRYSKGFHYSGSNNLCEVGWFKDNYHEKYLHFFNKRNPMYPKYNVGRFKSNELGLYDMSGGVFELCRDFYTGYISPGWLCFSFGEDAPYFGEGAFAKDPRDPREYFFRYICGGDFKSEAEWCNVYRRQGLLTMEEFRPFLMSSRIGIRLALEISNKGKDYHV